MFARIKSFLTENKTFGQTVIKNTFWMSFGQIVSRLIRAVVIIYAARVLGAAGYGAFSYALSLAGLFTIFSDIGLTPYLTREGARNPERRRQYIATAFTIKLGLILVSTALILFAVPIITKIPEAVPLLPIIVILFAFDTIRDFLFGITRSLEKMEIEAGVNIFTNLAVMVLGIGVLIVNPSSKTLTIAYTVGAFLGSGLALWKLREYFKNLWTFFSKDLLKPILTQAWPFGVAMLLNGVMLNTDTIMLGWLRTADEVGFYSAAQRVVLLLYILPGFLAASVFPALSRTAAADPEKFRTIFEKSLKAVLIIALPIIIGGLIVAPEFINLLFGSEYGPTVPAFQIVLLTVGLVFPGTIMGNGIFAYDKQRYLFRSAGLAAVGNVILNYFLIPRYGILGAAAATVITQFISNGYAFWIMKKLNRFRLFLDFRKVWLALIIMAGLTLGLQSLGVNVVLTILAAVIAYFLILYLSRESLLVGLKSRIREQF